MNQKQLFVTVQPYKRTSVRGNRHNVRGHFRTLSEFNLQQVLNPKVTTVVEVSPDTGKLLKQIFFTLSGALVVAAALRSR
jgi:hypothetical protein